MSDEWNPGDLIIRIHPSSQSSTSMYEGISDRVSFTNYLGASRRLGPRACFIVVSEIMKQNGMYVYIITSDPLMMGWTVKSWIAGNDNAEIHRVSL